jgi:hypothetical protein
MANLLDKASILITPTAYDVGSINAIKPKDSPYADLTFDRGTSATQTRVAGSNYIKDIGQDIPRLDFRGVNHWLFEPQATNTATYSNDFSQGSIFVSGSASAQNVVLTSAQGTSPDGTNNAWKMALSDATSQIHHLRYTNTTVVANNINVLSIFAKKGSGVDWFGIFADNLDATNRAWFNLANGTKGTLTNGLNSTIENYGNGWYRCSLAFSSTTDLQSEHVRIVITDSDSSSSYAGSTSDYHLIYGLQAESTSTSAYDYPTSYIPTSGSTATRDGETALDGGDSTMFNDTEGVLYIESAVFTNSDNFRTISISDGTNDETVRIRYGTTSNRIDVLTRSGGATKIDINYSVSDVTDFHKIAIKYKSGDSALWIDGVERATSAVTFSHSGLSKLQLVQGDVNAPFYGKIKSIAVFKEALSDTELQCLTS